MRKFSEIFRNFQKFGEISNFSNRFFAKNLRLQRSRARFACEAFWARFAGCPLRGSAALPGPLVGPASPVVARLSFELGFASVRARDALRCAPSRRVLKLSRINDFHLSALLLSQPFLFVRVFGKRQNRDVHGISRNRIQNQDILQFLLVLVDSRASCTFRAPFSAPQAFHLLTQRSSYFRW